MTTENNYLFYDIEVFSHDAFVVFKDIDKKIIRVFHNNFKKLPEFVHGKTLVGFNNYYYDDKILTYMMQQKSVYIIKHLNDQIINGETIEDIKPRFESLDVFQQIDVSMPSLKKIEGNMGRKIFESSVSFSIDRKLTKKEYRKSLNYCIYDVDTTIDIYKLRVDSYFKPKKSLIEMLGKDHAIRWNTTTISANLLLNKPLQTWAWARIPEYMWELVRNDVREMWSEISWSPKNLPWKNHITISEFGCDIQFGFGGLHGANQQIKKAKNVKLLDVKSMYPQIILNINGLGHATEKYKTILEKRLSIKDIDFILSDALKLILNSVFGNLNNEYSMLYNPKCALTVVIYGQIALYELCKRLAPFVTIININTDGIAFVSDDDRYIFAYQDWEKEFGLELDQKEFDLFLQKDVNNYIAVKDGKIKCKGGDVNRYEKDAFFKNNNARILDIALVNKLVYKKDEMSTITENLDKPHLFQYILKAGSTYRGSFDLFGTEYNKVNRVFASNKGEFCLFKKRYDDGLVRFADAPLKMFLWNDNCSEIKNFKNIVDTEHYYNLTQKRLERWK